MIHPTIDVLYDTFKGALNFDEMAWLDKHIFEKLQSKLAVDVDEIMKKFKEKCGE